MKRRNSRFSSKDSSPIRVPFPRSSYGAPGPAARSESQENKEDDSSVLSRRGSEAHNSNGPKTSEYAFFKKLKTDSGQNIHPQPIHEEHRPKRSTPNNCRRVHFADETSIATKISTVDEVDNAAKLSSGDFRCPFPARNFTDMNCEPCSSPIDHRTRNNSNLYLKKSNTDSGQKFHPQSIHEKDYRPKRSASKECWRDETDIARKTSTNSEGDNAVKNSSRDFRSPFPVKNFTNIEFDSFSSPADFKAAKNSKTTMKKAFSFSEDLCGVEKWIEIDSDDRISGCHSGQVDIFTRKRRNLRQFVSDCSVPEIDELCSKGSDIVSILLSRLFPRSNEKNSCENPESCSDLSTKSKFVSPHKLDVHLKELDQMPGGNFRGFECMPSFENGAISLWSDVLTEDMRSSSDSPFCCADNNYWLSNLGVSKRYRGGMDAISCVEIKSPFTLPIADYGSPPLLGLPLKELGDFHNVSGYLFERETPALLLEWDCKNTTDEDNLAITCQNTDMMRDFPVLNSGYDQEDLTSEFESFGARASSVLTNHPQIFYPLLPFHSASSQQYDLEEYGLEEKEEPIDFNHLPLTLSHSARYPCLTEDCNDETMFNGTYSFLSSERHHWSMSKVSYEGHGSPGNETSISHELGFGVKFLSLRGSTREHYTSPICALELPPKEISSPDLFTKDEDWKSADDSSYIRYPNHFSINMTDIHVRPPLYFQLSLDEAKTCPLLLDNSHWEASSRGTHYDDIEMEFF